MENWSASLEYNRLKEHFQRWGATVYFVLPSLMLILDQSVNLREEIRFTGFDDFVNIGLG